MVEFEFECEYLSVRLIHVIVKKGGLPLPMKSGLRNG